MGPDGIRLLKTCSAQLCGIFTYLFNLSLYLQKVPGLWKTSCLVPLLKKRHPTDHNGYRPVALTSHIMKTFERQVLSYIKASWSTYMDPLQFANQPSIGVDQWFSNLFHSSAYFACLPNLHTWFRSSAH